MCGIVGIISSCTVSERLIEGLKRLEYRGYDSSGIAVINCNQQIERRRAEGKLQNLSTLLQENPLHGNIGIGHTRWATHGKVCADNAHPMANDIVAVVHNGIIENYAELKNNLIKDGYFFTSETDTEVVMHLVSQEITKGLMPLEAVQRCVHKIKGSFALAFLFNNHHNKLIVTRKGSPLVIGITESEAFIGSDAIALAPWVKNLCYLEEGDIAELCVSNDKASYQIWDEKNSLVKRPIRVSQIGIDSISKGQFNHFMLKEIFEQPQTLSDTFQSLVSFQDEVYSESLNLAFQHCSHIRIIACGTSYFAGLLGKYWLEKYAQIPVDVEIASEFRYRSPVLNSHTLNIFISQSGETIDTLCALELVKKQGGKTVAIVNVAESSLARQADHVLMTLAGPEIGVASTKAFTTQLMMLAVICLHLSAKKEALPQQKRRKILSDLAHLPYLINNLLRNDDVYMEIGKKLSQANHALYLGRGLSYPIALEGALKLKEISYIHAEGYPAGELKHGPIALIDAKMPVIVLAPYDEWFEKTLSNIQETLTRGARVIVFTNSTGKEKIEAEIAKTLPIIIINLPDCDNFISPLLYTVPIQLLAYYTANMKGTDVDQPRNLAKSVTVE